MSAAAAAAARIRRVATDLGSVRSQVVFIGGTTLPLLVNVESRFDAPRPTKDVDAVAATASYTEMARMEASLRSVGFRHEPRSHAQRWRAPSGEIFDLSFAGAHTGGTGSRVDALAFRAAVEFPGEPTFRHVSGLGLLIMKSAAFGDRGRDAPTESRDLADLAVLLAGRSILGAEYAAAADEMRAAVAAAANALLDTPDLVSGLRSHYRDRRPIPPDTPHDLAVEAMERLRGLCTPARS